MAELLAILPQRPAGTRAAVLRVEGRRAQPVLKNSGLTFIDTPGVGGHGSPPVGA